MALNNVEEAAGYVTKLMQVEKKLTVSQQREDNAVHSAMRRCRYYTHTKTQSPNWSKVIHADILLFLTCVRTLVYEHKLKLLLTFVMNL